MVLLCARILCIVLAFIEVNGFTSKSLNVSDGPGTNVEMVVVAYKEDLSWIDPFLNMVPGMKLKLYCAGGIHPEPRCNPVPNLQDSNPHFLKHIIDNYDRLPTVTLFTGGSVLHGEWDWLLCKQLHYLVHKVNSAQKRSTFTYAAKPVWRFDPEFDIKVHRAYSGGPKVQHCRPTVAPFGAWLSKFVIDDLEKAQKSGVGFHNTQAVSADRIRKYPKSVYQSLYDELARCVPQRQTAAHYMERAWKIMLDDDPPSNDPDGQFQCPAKIKALKNWQRMVM